MREYGISVPKSILMVIGIIVINNTSSDILSLYTTDLPLLGNIQGYTGWLAPTAITDANGGVTFFPTLYVQVRWAIERGGPVTRPN